MVHEPVDGGERHGLGEDLAPFAERLVGRDQQRAAFVARRDQLEQHAGFGLVLGDVGDVRCRDQFPCRVRSAIGCHTEAQMD